VVITSNSKAPTGTTNSVNTLATLNDTGMASLTMNGIADTTISTLVDNTASVSIANAGTGVNANTDTITSWTDNNLKSLTLSGKVVIGALNDSFGGGVTVSGGSDNGAVKLVLGGATGAGTSDSVTLGNGADTVSDNTVKTANITLGNGADSVVTASATGVFNVTTGTGASTIDLHTTAGLTTVSVGTGSDTILGGTGGSSITVGASGANNVTVTTLGTGNTLTFGGHTGVDTVNTAALANGSTAPTAVITGLNTVASGNDVLGIADASAQPVLVLSSAGINTYANAHGLDATQFSTALAAAFSNDAANGALNLAQHQIGSFQFQGNTYVVEQAGANGVAVANGDFVIELVGMVNVTAASTAGAGTLTLHG
jgi:S-layer protein